MVDTRRHVHTPTQNADADTSALLWQRSVTERLLLSNLREQEAVQATLESITRANFLAAAARDLSMSLDVAMTYAALQRRCLPRPTSWCVVDIVEEGGVIRRLPALHPDPARRTLAFALGSLGTPAMEGGESMDISRHELRAMHGTRNFAILQDLGAGSLLTITLVARRAPIGFITFVTEAGEEPLSPAEVALAREIAARCAFALDNAQLYQAVEVLRKTAVAANEAKTTFMGNMSHELLTPLNAIGGYADIMEMELHGPVTEDQRRDLARIKLNQKHLLAMIAELLSFAQTGGQRTPHRLAPISVLSVINDVVEMAQGAAAERALMINREGAQHEFIAIADPDALRQVLVNLVMNSLKYASGSGTAITLRTEETNDAVLIHVGDDGPGIPTAKLGEIFEPFVQLAGGLTKRHGGMGLGLAISRGLAREMHGDVTVVSTPGHTTFTISLPRAARVLRA